MTSTLPAPLIHTLQLPAANGWLQATLTLPAAAGARAAITLLPPLVEERKASQRAMVDGSRHLAASAAAVVLQLDYRGTGNSSGDLSDFSVADWLYDIVVATTWLQRHFPELPPLLWGLRAGALLALQAATATTAGVILWEPVDGEQHLAQLLQRHMVNQMLAYGRAVESRKNLQREWQEGRSVDLDGYQFGANHYADIAKLELIPTTCPTLLLTSSPDTRVADLLAPKLQQYEQEQIRLAPFWNSVGHVETLALAEATAAWLCRSFPATLPLPPFRSPPALATHEVPLEIQLQESSNSRCGTTVRATLHRPSAGAPKGAMLLLGGWSGDSLGPHRLFLLFARQLAAAGYLVLRLDYRGRGTSDGRVDDATIASMLADATAAADRLQQEAGAETALTVIALCSGCKVAIALAAARPAISRLVLWSAEVMGSLRSADTNLRKSLNALRGYLRKLWRRETWRKILRGKVEARMVGKALVAHETRSPAEARAEDQWLARFRHYRGSVRFIYGGSDPAAKPAATAYQRFCERHKIAFELDTIPHAGHSFYSTPWRHELLRRTTAWLKL